MAIVNWNNALDDAKRKKMEELNISCEQTIIGKFQAEVDSIPYLFSCDDRAQANFEKIRNAFEKGWTTEEPWTAYNLDGNVVRISLTSTTFEPVYRKHLEHIRDNISKFRDWYMPQVMRQDATIQEIEAIKWE